MRSVAWWAAAGLLLAACGSGAARYAVPGAAPPSKRDADYEACVAEGQMIRGSQERQLLIDNCMGERGYRVEAGSAE